MKSFHKKVLAAAIVGSSLTVAGVASAVSVNPEGLGEALIYPHYTARNGAATLISVVNTSDRAKAVKVRIVEGKNTAEVLDFNLWLSARDVWTGAIIKNPAGDGGLLLSTDKSCTNPRIPASGVAFRNFAYAGDTAAQTTLDRTLEGYVEIIEMAEIAAGSVTESDVTHSAGVAACTQVTDARATARVTAGDYLPATGGIFGSGTIVGANMSTGYNATAIVGFGSSGYTTSGSVNPSLASGTNLVAVTVDAPVAGTTRVVAADFATTAPDASLNAVSAVLMHSSVMGEYTYGTSNGANFATDWVLTFPTKRPYVNGTGAPFNPFQRAWDRTTGTACVDVTLNSWGREEETSVSPDDFSPLPPTGTNSLCWESTVLSFGPAPAGGGSSVLGSRNVAHWTSAFQASAGSGGWGEVVFGHSSSNLVSRTGGAQQTLIAGASIPAATTGLTATYRGLPVIGFGIVSATFANATSNYNSSYSLNFRRTITLQ